MALSHSNVHEFAALLYKCRKEKDLAQALHLHHVFMNQSGLDVHGSQLVSILVDLGSMCHARQVFERMNGQDAFSWNALITGYVRHDKPKDAVSLYQRMREVQDRPILPSDSAFVALLKACAILKDPSVGHSIHVEAARLGVLKSNTFVGCSLVDMYAKCGYISAAHEMFKALPIQDTVSWNALMTGYAELGYGKKALECFAQMQQKRVSGDAVTFVCTLKACGSIGDISKGQEIHDEVVRKGLESNNLICNSLVDIYARCGLLVTAKGVFDKIPNRDVVSCNSLLNGLVEQGHWKEVLALSQQMEHDGISFSNISCIYILRACSSVGSPAKGQEVHAEIMIRGLERAPLLGSSLVDMYAKCGLLLDAHKVLDRLPSRGVAAWTALMAGYAEHGHGKQLLDCFEQMRTEGISPDAHTFSCSLKACGSIGATEAGQELHAEIAGKGLEKELLIGNTLVNMYANLGLLATAQNVFDKLAVRDMVSLNALIVGYSERGCGEEALHCFDQMQHNGIALNPVSVICILKACFSIGSVMKGREIHVKVVLTGMEQERLIGNILIDFYVKFSLLAEAQVVFDRLVARDIISWTCLLGGYANRGFTNDVFFIFGRMKEEGITPNLVTLVHVLNACNHAGLVKKGQSYFESISEDYGLTPEMDHYTCIIDLLGRAGHTDKAVTMIRKMPIQPDRAVWHAMLGACCRLPNVELGRFAFENAVRLDERAAATYLYMFNIYTRAGMYEEADTVEAMRKQNQAWT